MTGNERDLDSSEEAPLPRLLKDGPAPNDEFGSHERIAEGMASLINNQDGGHVIGLRGQFGSGKSTTVAELEKKLSPDEWSVITFDAWTHRGHELMRAFLASIIDQLSEEIGKKQARQKRQEVIDEEEVKHTITQSTINGWGQLLVGIGIFATVVTAGLRASDSFSYGTTGFPVPVSLLLWLGWLPWVALLLVVLIGFFGPWPSPSKDDLKSGSWLKKWGFPRFLVNWRRKGVFSLRIFQDGERTRTTVTSSGAANSITFQETFSKIVEMAVENTDRKIIVVLDNMDRLEEQEQLMAWSTVEAFIDAKFSLKNRVWFVLPLSYAESHEEGEGQSLTSAKLRENLADKMFLTEFRVPELVLTDWVAYVRTLCQKILTHADVKIQEAVARVIVSWQRQIDERPRPRGLRAIINQIGGLYHQWRDDVPLDVIALYVVKIQDIESKGERLLDETLIADFAEVPGRNAVRCENISQELAMLHFSAPREKALQILVRDSFSKAMTTGKELSSDGLAIPHVETLIDHVARDVLNEIRPGSTILSISACLGKAVSAGAKIQESTWVLLLDRFMTAEEPWNLADEESLEEGAKYLVSHFRDRSIFEVSLARQIGLSLMPALSTREQENDAADELSAIIEFWRTMRRRLALETNVPISPTAAQLYALLCQIETDDVVTYDFEVSDDELTEVVSVAMTEGIVPAALVEALDYLEPTLLAEKVEEWSAQIVSFMNNEEVSLESKVSACEIVLLFGPDSSRATVIDHVPSVLNGSEEPDLSGRTQLAIGLMGALTGRYLTDSESGVYIEYLNNDTIDAAIELLNRWRFRGRLWGQVQISEGDEMRDALLRSLHEAYPKATYAGVEPKQFDLADISDLEDRVGRSTLIHLASQPELKVWIQYVSGLDLGAGQLPLLNLVMEAQSNGKQAIMDIVNDRLSQTDRATFLDNLLKREDGYASLFDLERHGVKIAWPECFFEAAAQVLTQKGWVFKSSKIPKSQREKMLAGVWSKVLSGEVNMPTLLLEEHIGPYVQSRYNSGGRVEFTEKVLPTMIREGNSANLAWAVDFLFARHRRKSTIPNTSDAVIQAAITDAYPHSDGEMKTQIERLAAKGWFSLPSRLRS